MMFSQEKVKGIDLKNSGTSSKPLLLGRIVKFLFGDPNSKKIIS